MIPRNPMVAACSFPRRHAMCCARLLKCGMHAVHRGPGSVHVCIQSWLSGRASLRRSAGEVVPCSHGPLTKLLTAQTSGWRDRVRPQSGARAVRRYWPAGAGDDGHIVSTVSFRAVGVSDNPGRRASVIAIAIQGIKQDSELLRPSFVTTSA
jgi:hypothetical protein